MLVSTILGAVITALVAAPGCAGEGRPSSTAVPRPSVVPTFTSKVLVVPGLAEPLVTTKATTEAEDRALRNATAANDGSRDPLVAFLAAHPDSGWSAAIHTNLGLAYYREGFFSRAIAAYEAAWREGRDAADFRAKTLVDRALGELARMHARVGHLKELDALMAEIGDRPIQGGAREFLTGAGEGAWSMRNNPGVSYLCGPKALANVLDALHGSPKATAVVNAARSGEHGFTLAQLGALADKAGVAHRLVHRAPGEPVPVPSVINWRVSHYAAVVGKTDRGTYQVKDPTFGGDLEVSEAAIDEEGSGFFLVPEPAKEGPKDDLRLAWRDATASEAQATFGMGDPGSSRPGQLMHNCDNTTSGGGGAGSAACQSQIPTGRSCTGPMCAPTAYAMEVSLDISDTPVGYAPPVGPPAYIRLTYNQREAVEPYGPASNPVYFNVGPQWTLGVLSYVIDNPVSPGATVSRYFPGGGAVAAYTDYVAATGAFDPENQSGAILTRTPTTGMATSYTVTGTDGSQLVYAQSDGSTSASTYRRMFLTTIRDPHGNALTLDYDTSLTTAGSAIDAGSAGFFPRLSAITDATGTTATTFTYGLAATPLLVTQITDAFGRSASITYDANGRLSSITDILGITSTVAYDDGNTPPRPTFVKQLTTPYGTTGFDFGETNAGTQIVTRWLETTDPLGQTERLEFSEGVAGGSTGIPAMDETGVNLPEPAGMPLPLAQAATLLLYRNTFFWNKHVYHSYGTGTGKDYTKAELTHWLHTNNGLYVAPTIESVRRPLEHRVWYEYAPSQTSSVLEGPATTYLGIPTTVARVLDDGSTQLTSITRNKLGKPLLVTDPLGRQTQLTYAANNTDLVLVQQKTSATGFATVGSYAYNTQHQPLSYTDASGQTTRYGYNAAGQLQTVTDALGEVQTLTYDASGRLATVLDANHRTTLTLAYDAFNRVATRADALGYVTSYAYDNFDRVTRVTYPDGTFEQYGYTNLDLTSVTDRLGQVTTYAYDANRQLASVTDPLMQVTKYAYYEDGALKSITDPNNNTTSWDIDIQNRPTAKHYADGTSDTYAYEASTSRLKSKTDALGQFTSYAYNADDSLAGVTYGGSTAAVATAPVTFTYDPLLPRPTAMTDGVGTTTYSYYPIAATPTGQDGDAGVVTPTVGAGRLEFVASPVAGATGGAVDVVSYAYDALGRVTGRSVDGSSQGITFDPLGRPVGVTNALDAFAYGYADETARVTSVTSAHGPTVALAYYDPASHPEQNELLQQMTYTAQGGGANGVQVLSQFGYAYDANSNVTTFTETHLAPPSPAGGTPGDSGETGMTIPRSLKGHHGASKLAAGVWTRTRQTAGRGGVLIFGAGLLLAVIAWMRAGRRRFASALTPFALGLVFAACGGDDSNHGGPSVGDGGGDAGGDATAMMPDAGGGEGGGGTDAGGVLETQVTAYQYDAASRLVAATLGTAGMPPAATATPQYAYTYDPASNPTSIAANGSTLTRAYTSTNEIVGGNYDPNGSPKTLGGAAYTWDAEDRLLSATVGGVESDFTYDGMGRVARIVSKQAGILLSDKAYTWSGTTRVAEHDNAKSGSPVSKQYFAQGVVDEGQGYYYSVDQLGSVRQLVDASGAIRAQYDYDPYGNQTKLDGDVDSDSGFAGYFYHAPIGVSLSLSRGYAPSQGRWLNRDPSGVSGGLNLYSYVNGNPPNYIDPTARAPEPVSVVIGAVSGGLTGALSGYRQCGVFGAVVGGVVGASFGAGVALLNPGFSPAAAAWGVRAAFIALDAVANVIAAEAQNASTNVIFGKQASDGWLGNGVGALAVPLASGSAYLDLAERGAQIAVKFNEALFQSAYDYVVDKAGESKGKTPTQAPQNVSPGP